ncbi:uncharacterized protein Nmlp_1279 [Natronomonas moolapensis 8.8.11]|uniref:Uncharacterized protein n=1 Tax=Natronomonas moolapensis (strain DSM 18674 / CECT 7526 / JCM 14361 / 8.8.11) TaxID=268739 RepID=M1XK94_NATM8|nr:hypothetical protein [Natronomonas moolapensis]CCQ35488.1 uncharacterized protein Nmlp_1279 [Natronomonas moolapensis 8.8.11]
MTDDNSNTPAGEHEPSIEMKIDYDDYGLHEQESATTIIRISHETSLFERVGKIESVSSGIVLKEHTRLTDNVADDITEAYTPIQFISARTDGFESRVEEAIFEFVYDEKVSEELAERLAETLAETFSDIFDGLSSHS